MSKIVTLVVVIIAVANVVYSFFGNSDTDQIFGMEMNIWIYRLIWSVIGIGVFYNYFKKNKAANNQ